MPKSKKKEYILKKYLILRKIIKNWKKCRKNRRLNVQFLNKNV